MADQEKTREGHDLTKSATVFVQKAVAWRMKKALAESMNRAVLNLKT